MTNANLIERLINCWNTGQLEDIDQVLSPDFVRHEPEMDGGTTSRDEYKETVRRYRSVLTDFHTAATETIEQGDKVAFRFKTTGKRNNTPFTFEGVNVVHVEGGRIVEDWVYFDATGVRGKLARAQTA